MGYVTEASGPHSTTLGTYSIANTHYTTAMGYQTTASGHRSTAIGYKTTASGDSSTAMGASTIASGSVSTAMGHNTTAESYREITLGSWNTDYTPDNTTAWDSDDRLFVLGNGASSGTRSDAVVVLKNGNTGIGTATPDEKLEVEFSSSEVDIELGQGTTDSDVTFLTLRSPNGTKYYITVSDAGVFTSSTTKP
jgi:hypothetical protein